MAQPILSSPTCDLAASGARFPLSAVMQSISSSFTSDVAAYSARLLHVAQSSEYTACRAISHSTSYAFSAADGSRQWRFNEPPVALDHAFLRIRSACEEASVARPVAQPVAQPRCLMNLLCGLCLP